MRLLPAICLAFILVNLSACAQRPGVDVLQPVALAVDTPAQTRLLVVSTRDLALDNVGTTTAADRSDKLNFAAFSISVPANHQKGEIEYPNQVPANTAQQFATIENRALTESEFLGEIRRTSFASGPDAHRVLVFVHGYNTLYQESVFRFAQLLHDSGFKGTAVLFAWPSSGIERLYLADREATNYSRDYFEAALNKISKQPEVGEINILAHSMGGWLTMETLRQAKLRGNGSFNGKLGEVILAAPDLDLNVFRTQLDVVTPTRKPLTLLVSGDDRALYLSQFLGGGVERVGQLDATDPSVGAIAQKYNLRIIDLSAVKDLSGTNHNKFTLLGGLGRSFLQNNAREASPAGVIYAVTDVGKSIIRLPLSVVGR